ncbi:MAG: sulfurtransferase [Comamonadaceae bacterium]|nr:MAG: sulfurtransferase [Comamonadaceae bacterium]
MMQLMSLMVANAIAVVFFASFGARLGLPVPAGPLLVVAGALGAAGHISLVSALAAAVVANILGDGIWFYAGRRYGYRFMQFLCRVSMSPDSCVRRSESLITRWGGLSLLAAKFVPGVSVVAPPMAGALGMSSWRFIAFETLAAACWAVVFLGLGYVFRDEIQRVLVALADAGTIAMVVLVLAVLVTLAVRYVRRRRFMRLTGMPRISVDELQSLMNTNVPPLVIDVRGDANQEIDPRRIPGALPLGLKAIQQRRTAYDFDVSREVVLYCNCPNEVSAALAARALEAQGVRRARPLAGGLDAWVAAGQPTAAQV